MAAMACFALAPTVSLSARLQSEASVRPVASSQSQAFGRSLSMKAFVQRRSRSSALVVKASTPKVEEDISTKIEAAKETCESGTTGECAAAWDEIEEISAEAAHAKVRAKENSDPLEAFCKDNPETDECRTYED